MNRESEHIIKIYVRIYNSIKIEIFLSTSIGYTLHTAKTKRKSIKDDIADRTFKVIYFPVYKSMHALFSNTLIQLLHAT